MTKSSIEIIKAAANLAQVNDSEAFSWKRRVEILNAEFISLWNKIVSSDENFAINSVELNINDEGQQGGTLPADLYSIRSITSASTGTPLERYDAFSPNIPSFHYRLQNNEIDFNNPEGPILLVYATKPPDLTFTNDSTYYTANELRLNGQYLADRSDNIINLFFLEDLETPVHQYTIDDSIDKWDLTVTGSIIILSNDQLIVYDRINRTVIPQATIDFLIDDSAYVVFTNGTLTFELNNALQVITNNERPFAPLWIDRYVRFDSGYLQVWDPINYVWNNYIEAHHVIFDKGSQYVVVYTNPHSVIVMGDSTEWEYRNLYLIDFSSNSKDWGYLGIARQATENYITSLLPNTALDWPNTVYFDWLETKIAETMLVQVKQDVTAIQQLRLERESTLNRLITRNKIDAYKVRNVYKGDRRL